MAGNSYGGHGETRIFVFITFYLADVVWLLICLFYVTVIVAGLKLLLKLLIV